MHFFCAKHIEDRLTHAATQTLAHKTIDTYETFDKTKNKTDKKIKRISSAFELCYLFPCKHRHHQDDK